MATERKAIFISHATPEDNHFVRWLGAKLTAMGYEVWADVMRLHGGVDWARELEGALRKRAAKMLLVCTPTGLEKQGVRNEIQIGSDLARQLNDKAFIIPLRLETPYEAPFLVAQAQYIDFKAGWARGLTELADLLRDIGLPREAPDAMTSWLNSHALGADQLLAKSEPLASNWLQVQRQPKRIHFCESVVGAPLEPFLNRQHHSFAAVPHRAGVITFAVPDADGNLGTGLPGKYVASISTRRFLEGGWPDYGIEPYEAKRMYSDLGAQAFDKFCRDRGLKGFSGSGRRVSWWGDIKTAPSGQVRFDWSYRRGSRQVIGQSGKRGVHWHYAMNAQLRASPLWHLRVTPRLVFSENGMDAIEDAKRSHVLRRSFAKGWRNARWRDMLCAYLWWLADRKSELHLPVAAGEVIALAVPPMQFSCPVTVLEGDELPPDDDDPDIPADVWADEMPEEDEE
ncbi:MAG TPA: toll/interleukin-1 receptor domain-containing protein [Accumulibacter sp.]|nr:toll/interleukin-1 receptor domain-containing protein [Accumulibacter sp.]